MFVCNEGGGRGDCFKDSYVRTDPFTARGYANENVVCQVQSLRVLKSTKKGNSSDS